MRKVKLPSRTTKGNFESSKIKFLSFCFLIYYENKNEKQKPHLKGNALRVHRPHLPIHNRHTIIQHPMKKPHHSTIKYTEKPQIQTFQHDVKLLLCFNKIML